MLKYNDFRPYMSNFFGHERNVKRTFNTFRYFTDIIASEAAPFLFRPARSFFSFRCSSARFVYFSLFLALRFFSLREIHRSNPALHALCVWPIFLCAGEPRKMIFRFFPLLPLTHSRDSFPAFFPFYVAVRFLRYAPVNGTRDRVRARTSKLIPTTAGGLF